MDMSFFRIYLSEVVSHNVTYISNNHVFGFFFFHWRVHKWPLWCSGNPHFFANDHILSNGTQCLCSANSSCASLCWSGNDDTVLVWYMKHVHQSWTICLTLSLWIYCQTNPPTHFLGHPLKEVQSLLNFSSSLSAMALQAGWLHSKAGFQSQS